MQTTETTIVEAVRSMTNKQLVEAVVSLTARIEQLEALRPTTSAKSDSVEMTEDHARRVIFGDLKDTKHKDAALALNLTYGQIYSARKGFTFKQIHKEGASV